MKIEIEIENKTLIIWNPKANIRQIIDPHTGIVEHDFSEEYFDYIDCAVFDEDAHPINYIENYTPTEKELQKIKDEIYEKAIRGEI